MPGDGALRRFVFLDRDGTLLDDPGYLHRVEDYALLPGVLDGLRELQSAGFALAIVTNQSGIGRGYYTQDDFETLQRRLIGDLEAAGVRIEATYFCPHLPDAGCECRKPAPGMLQRAERELDADLSASWVIGDAPTDVGLAQRAGCRGVLIGDGQIPGVADAARKIVGALQVQLRQ